MRITTLSNLFDAEEAEAIARVKTEMAVEQNDAAFQARLKEKLERSAAELDSIGEEDTTAEDDE